MKGWVMVKEVRLVDSIANDLPVIVCSCDGILAGCTSRWRGSVNSGCD